MVYCNWYLVDYLYFKVSFQCNSEEIESKETDISWCNLKENYKMSDICKDREALRPEYEHFIQTERGKEWKHFWQSQINSDIGGDFGDYLYDFYPEMLQ